MTVAAEQKIEPISKQSLRVWLKLLKVNSFIESALRRRLRDEFGSTLPRFDVMSALNRHPEGLKMSEISGLLRVSNGNVTGIVERLVEDGFVQRRPVPKDRRALKIKLTVAGQAAFAAQAAAHEAWIADLLSGLGSGNLNAFGAMLEDINGHLEEIGDGRS